MNTVGNVNDMTNEHAEKLAMKWWSGEDFKTYGA